MHRKWLGIFLSLLVAGVFGARSGVFAQDPTKGILPFESKIPRAALAGFYERTKKQEAEVNHHYLRLLPDGTVLDLTTADSRENVARRLVKGATGKAIAYGTFKFQDGHVEFTTTNEEATVHYEGVISENSLILDWNSTYKNSSAKKQVYKLIPGL